MVNPLGLNTAELDALRELQIGMAGSDAGDPIWDELVAVGVLDLQGPAPLPTLLGRRYRTE